MSVTLDNANRVVGIVVQSIPFQDHHQIISLYSAEWGLMRIIIKYAYAKKNSCSVEPLNLVEICLKKSKSDLFQSSNVSHLNTYLNLRSSYRVLVSSLDLLSSIIQSQVFHKPSPILFSLLLRYLDYMPNAKSPESLKASFKLKILRHDGWLALVEECSSCQKTLQDIKVAEGQFYCQEHSIPNAITLTANEMDQLKDFTLARSFSQIDQEFLSSTLEEKVNSLFAEFIT